MGRISRKEAKAQGLKFYYTGIECRNGHTVGYYVSSGKCSQCEKDKASAYRKTNKEKTSEYQRRWRENNKEKIRENKRIHRQENKEYLKERDAKYYKENKDRIREVSKEYSRRNVDRIKEYQRQWRDENKEYKHSKDLEYKQENREKLKEQSREYYRNNKEEISLKEKLRYQENREERLKYANEYRNKNKDEINKKGREYRKQYHVMARRRDRDAYLRKHCPKTITMNKCRELLHRTLKVINEDKKDSTYTILGYNSAELREHVERYMIDGMTWENFGEYWCLDHRYPVSRLVKMGITDCSIINSLYNLRPMLTIHNLSKWTKTEAEYYDSESAIADMYPKMLDFDFKGKTHEP